MTLTRARLLIALTMSLISAEARAAEGHSTPALPLVWVDVEGAAGAIQPTATTEATAILEAAGVPVHWISSDGGQRVAANGEIQIVLLTHAPPVLPARVMGGVQRTNGDGSTVWVFLAPIHTAVGCPRPSEPSASTCAQDVGRAAGRVIVHEIVHLLAPDLPHTHDGLMAPQLGRAALVEGDLDLNVEVRRVLHTFGTRLALPRAPRSSPPSRDRDTLDTRAGRHPVRGKG